MGIHPLALTRGLNREQIEQAVEYAVATVAVGNGPTMVLILGHTDDGLLVEASGVIRDEDVLFVHAAPSRPEYQRLLEAALAQPGAGARGIPDGGPEHGWSVDGLAVTDELIEELRERAAKGHHVDVLRIRLRTGRPAPLSLGETVRLELDPAVHAPLAAQADADGVSVHEQIRRVLRERLLTAAR